VSLLVERGECVGGNLNVSCSRRVMEIQLKHEEERKQERHEEKKSRED
jgi:predicted DNA-binding protein with PD1-like motif